MKTDEHHDFEISLRRFRDDLRGDPELRARVLAEPAGVLEEQGLSLPPDWVGDFYFHVDDERWIERVFEPGMVTNFESLFSTALIDTIVYEPEGCRVLSKTPLEVIATG